MSYGVVIPVGPGRQENLELCLRSLSAMRERPPYVVLILDGPDVETDAVLRNWPFLLEAWTEPRHEPGREQPRNVGVRRLMEVDPKATHVWFLDSDVIVSPDALGALIEAREEAGEDTIQLGPYEWLPPGVRHPLPDLCNDPRWESFGRPLGKVSRGALNDGLACFSGNLVWPIGEFVRIGGFWNEIHHGRCEDGELGLRAVAEGVPIQFVPRARGWHLDHPRNMELALQRNARDVPMLNARHPWVEGQDVFVVDRDGKRFDQLCPKCGTRVNTIDYWSHAAECGAPLTGPQVSL